MFVNDLQLKDSLVTQLECVLGLMEEALSLLQGMMGMS